MIHGSHEAPALSLGSYRFSLCLKTAVEQGQIALKIGEGAFKVLFWHKEMSFDIGLFNAISCLAGEDYKLANNVDAA